MSFQNWHKEFQKFWSEHLKVSKFHFNGILLNKVYIVWAKKVQRSYLSWNWRGIQNLEGNRLFIQNWHKEFDRFWPEHSKVSNHFHFKRLLLSKVYIVWAKKSTEELSFMKLKRDTKFWEESTFRLGNDIMNLAKFHQSTRKCQNWNFDRILLSKVENVWA